MRKGGQERGLVSRRVKAHLTGTPVAGGEERSQVMLGDKDPPHRKGEISHRRHCTNVEVSGAVLQ